MRKYSSKISNKKHRKEVENDAHFWTKKWLGPLRKNYFMGEMVTYAQKSKNKHQNVCSNISHFLTKIRAKYTGWCESMWFFWGNEICVQYTALHGIMWSTFLLTPHSCWSGISPHPWLFCRHFPWSSDEGPCGANPHSYFSPSFAFSEGNWTNLFLLWTAERSDPFRPDCLQTSCVGTPQTPFHLINLRN